MVGKLAFSQAGHDKGTLYLIVREEGTRVYLADGVFHTYAVPKKKNRKHIQPLNAARTAEEMKTLADNPADADTKIKRWIKLFSKEI